MLKSYYKEQRFCSKYFTVPKRWINTPQSGDVIAGKFIPFKTPLDDKYISKLNECDKFTPKMFMSSISTYKLGLWLDLTFSTKYYDKNIIENEGIKYVKCQCRGHDECPTLEQTKVFIEICENFLSTYPDDLIAVHCTHGFNRTGFLICAYLIEKCGWTVENAINAFSKARPPGIKKRYYVVELYKRFTK